MSWSKDTAHNLRKRWNPVHEHQFHDDTAAWLVPTMTLEDHYQWVWFTGKGIKRPYLGTWTSREQALENKPFHPHPPKHSAPECQSCGDILATPEDLHKDADGLLVCSKCLVWEQP